MGSTALAPVVQKVNTLEQTSRKRSSGKKNQRKVPKRVHKAEREKMKREYLNELFLGLATALDLGEQSNGKASILREATRLLKNLLIQIEFLKKENTSLFSETHYMTAEKNEVEEENSVLETQIEKLKGEIEARLAQSRPNLNVPPHLELQQPEKRADFVGDSLQFSPHHQAALSAPDVAKLKPKPVSTLNKPHAWYPSPMDLWPLQLLEEQPTSS